MRIWSIHPQYLDVKGLVAVWRETLLAKAVLEGKTKGYTHHPQLIRFRNHPMPMQAIAAYLQEIFLEAQRRRYTFNSSKIGKVTSVKKIPVTTGQLFYEWSHLQKKLFKRDRKQYFVNKNISNPIPHPLFTVVEGVIEEWEKVKTGNSSKNNFFV